MLKKLYAPIRVVIADDHAIFREGLKVLLRSQPELTMIGEAGNGEELLAVVDSLNPDIVLTDIKMPKMDGISACKLICEKYAATKVIAISMFNDDNTIMGMLEAGATGYLLKNAEHHEMFGAIRTVYEGQSYYSPATTQCLARMIKERKFNPYRQRSSVEFTQRELEVIRLICDQFMNKEIADELKVSIRTVESYRNSILEKIGAKNSVGIVLYAIKHKLVQSE
jgi:DNA-binding NarL/FixJ family response regulator